MNDLKSYYYDRIMQSFGVATQNITNAVSMYGETSPYTARGYRRVSLDVDGENNSYYIVNFTMHKEDELFVTIVLNGSVKNSRVTYSLLDILNQMKGFGYMWIEPEYVWENGKRVLNRGSVLISRDKIYEAMRSFANNFLKK